MHPDEFHGSKPENLDARVGKVPILRRTLATQQGCGDAETRLGGRLVIDDETQVALFRAEQFDDERGPETPYPLRATTADFLSRQATLLLTDSERASIAARPRFYSMPWLRFHDPTDPDDKLF